MVFNLYKRYHFSTLQGVIVSCRVMNGVVIISLFNAAQKIDRSTSEVEKGVSENCEVSKSY